jgi:hypothetical protein
VTILIVIILYILRAVTRVAKNLNNGSMTSAPPGRCPDASCRETCRCR